MLKNISNHLQNFPGFFSKKSNFQSIIFDIFSKLSYQTRDYIDVTGKDGRKFTVKITNASKHLLNFCLNDATFAKTGKFSLTISEIAERIGKTPKAVQKIFRRYNFPRLHNIAPPRQEERLGWKGGMKIVKGYEYQRTPDHPHASKHGRYVAVHRLVMEKKLGRYLLPTEVVDHIDGNTRNNHPDNLRVFASNADHLRVTLVGRCPKWSEDGKRRISEAVKRRHQTRRDAAIQPSPVE